MGVVEEGLGVEDDLDVADGEDRVAIRELVEGGDVVEAEGADVVELQVPACSMLVTHPSLIF